MAIKLEPLSSNKVLDVTNKFPSKLDCNLSFVKFEHLTIRKPVIDGRECISAHYPVDEVMIGGDIVESELIQKLEKIHKLQSLTLKEKVDSVLFTGIFKYYCHYEDIDWVQEKGQVRLEMSFDRAEKYFKDLGYENTYLYSKKALDGKVTKVLLPETAASIITVKFSPAGRFPTVNTVAKELYAFVYQNLKENAIEIMAESNYLVVLEHPELVVHITD